MMYTPISTIWRYTTLRNNKEPLTRNQKIFLSTLSIIGCIVTAFTWLWCTIRLGVVFVFISLLIFLCSRAYGILYKNYILHEKGDFKK